MNIANAMHIADQFKLCNSDSQNINSSLYCTDLVVHQPVYKQQNCVATHLLKMSILGELNKERETH